jgi:hypothetical protein
LFERSLAVKTNISSLNASKADLATLAYEEKRLDKLVNPNFMRLFFPNF